MKWKDELLKTSLPLEQIVAERVAKRGFYVAGEYVYTRPNEHEVPTEFSVDLYAFDLIRSKDDLLAQLSLMIECKYCYPGVNWVFMEHSNYENTNAGIITILDELSGVEFHQNPLLRIDNRIRYCVKGISLRGSEAEPHSISRALAQIRYATSEFAIRQILRQSQTMNYEDLSVELLCPMVVTTASLRIMKSGLTLDEFRSAHHIDDVSEEVPALSVYTSYSPKLADYVTELWAEAEAEIPDHREALKQLRELHSGDRGLFGWPDEWSLKYALQRVSEHVLVVSLGAVERILKVIKRASQDGLRQSQQYAYQEFRFLDKPRTFTREKPIRDETLEFLNNNRRG